MAASNCLVLPSYREGFPNVVLQACSMQIPSIVSNINGCNEIIHDKVNGLLVQPKNIESLYLAMKKIYLDKKLFKSLSCSLRENVVKNYKSEIFHSEMLSNYFNLSNKTDSKS